MDRVDQKHNSLTVSLYQREIQEKDGVIYLKSPLLSREQGAASELIFRLLDREVRKLKEQEDMQLAPYLSCEWITELGKNSWQEAVAEWRKCPV